ncbi:hypothetical protein SLA2020_127540 [Shorea laevis]
MDHFESSTKRRQLDTFDSLNSDIPFEVLSRLPTKFLPGMKCVSRAWHRLISDRTFLKVQMQSQKREPVSGFFVQQRYQYCEDDIKTISYIPVETEGDELKQTIFNFLPEEVALLTSCNGLVCCRSCLPFQVASLYICNPLNHQWIKLAWDEPDKEHSFALAFDPSQDLTDTSTNFKLVRVQKSETGLFSSCFSFEVYSSNSGAWMKSTEVCQCNDDLYKNKGIFIGGVLHWLTDGDEILTFKVESELSWLVSTPLPVMEINSIPAVCIGECDSRLHYVMVSDYGLHVWLLEDYYESRWSLKLSKSLDEMQEEYSNFSVLRAIAPQWQAANHSPWMDPLAFKDGHLLMRVCLTIFLYDVELNKIKDVCAVSELGNNSTYFPTVLPYTLSLVPLN